MPSGATGTPNTCVTSAAARCSIGICVARSERQVERGDRRRDVERHAVLLGQHGHRIGADLVGHVAVGGDAVRAHHHAADAPGLQEVPGHVVGDQRGRDAVLLQFPDREPRALQEGPGLVGEDVDLLAGGDRGADHAERRAVARRGQRAGVAVRQHRLAVRHQRRAVAADGLVDGDVFEVDLLALPRPARSRISSSGLPAQAGVERFMRSMAQNRLTAVGRVRGQRVADLVELPSRSARRRAGRPARRPWPPPRRWPARRG